MSNLTPFFSVIIPTYNRADKLKATLQSVINQSFADFEILVVDDGSVDHTKAVIDAFQDRRITYFWIKNSGGPATPRNYGIVKSQSDWVCFLDADDIWYPDKLMRVYEAIKKNPEMDVFCHNEIMRDLRCDKKSSLRYGPFEPDFYQVMLKLGNRLSTSATSVRRTFLNKNNLRFNQSPEYVIVEDYDLWLRIALSGGKFYFIDLSLGEYIIENDNISSNLRKMQHNSSVLIRDHVYRLQNFETNKDRLFGYIQATRLMSEAKIMLTNGHPFSAIHLVFNAFKISPTGAVGYISSKTTKFFRI